MRVLIPLVAALALASPSWAGDLALSFVSRTGGAVANVVAMVRPQAGTARVPIRFPWPYRVAQRDMQFEPFVLIVPVGAEVTFPNLDPFRHHVYSFSPAKTFELKLYSSDQARSVRFDRSGVVVLGCNIHDDMIGFIRVVDTPYAGKSGASGVLVLRDLPPGPATLTIWHPYLKQPGSELVRQVTVPKEGALALKIAADLRAPRMRRGY